VVCKRLANLVADRLLCRLGLRLSIPFSGARGERVGAQPLSGMVRGIGPGGIFVDPAGVMVRVILAGQWAKNV
jgi:hypothetical protein